MDNDLTKICWLQILTNLIDRYPDTLHQAAVSVQVVLALSSLLQTTRTAATKRHCLAACLSLVRACQQFGESGNTIVLKLELEMRKMW